MLSRFHTLQSLARLVKNLSASPVLVVRHKSKLAMDQEEFRKAAHAVVDDSRFHWSLQRPGKPSLTACLVIKYNATLPTRPVLPKIQPGYLKDLIPSTAPERPEPWPSIQADVESKIIPGLTHWQSPNFMAFFPALVTYPSLLGEMYSAAFTAPAFNWLCSPACTELETIVMDWVAIALALPDCFLSTSPGGGGGVIHGSASEAIVTVMVAARERYLRIKADLEGLQEGTLERDDRIAFLRGRMVALSSDQAHSSTQKGALIAGTRYRSIATSLSEDLALTAPRLEEALQQCCSGGLEPYYLTLSLGTTSTCAVDDFASIATLRSKYPNLWIHIDAAYAGAALVLPEFQTQYSSSIGAVADSFNFNMHKWLLVNFDASCLFVQNRNHLTRALAITPSYLQNTFTDSGLVTDYRDWQIPLGRRFRALKIWFVMRSYGVEGLRAHIENSIRVGEAFRDMVAERKGLFEIVATPRFALTCFRVRPEFVAARAESKKVCMNGHASQRAQPVKAADFVGEEIEEEGTMKVDAQSNLPRMDAEQHGRSETLANTVTKDIAELINSRGAIFITASTTAGKTFIRVVSGSPSSSEEYARKAFEIIVSATEEVLGKYDGEELKN
jgi:aromatic-L-amino-acid/L-tryptophan decarboxylase